MIDIRQQVGHKKNGRRVVFQIDKVYRVDSTLDSEEYLGWCGRTEDAAFHPHHPLTDVEKKEVVNAINAHHEESGYPPLATYGREPLSIGEINRLVRSMVPKRPKNAEDDDD